MSSTTSDFSVYFSVFWTKDLYHIRLVNSYSENSVQCLSYILTGVSIAFTKPFCLSLVQHVQCLVFALKANIWRHLIDSSKQHVCVAPCTDDLSSTPGSDCVVFYTHLGFLSQSENKHVKAGDSRSSCTCSLCRLVLMVTVLTCSSRR